jgi:hypothetical protein
MSTMEAHVAQSVWLAQEPQSDRVLGLVHELEPPPVPPVPPLPPLPVLALVVPVPVPVEAACAVVCPPVPAVEPPVPVLLFAPPPHAATIAASAAAALIDRIVMTSTLHGLRTAGRPQAVLRHR